MIFTYEKVKTIIEGWNSKTIEELSKMTDIKPTSIYYLAWLLRKKGYDLPRRSRMRGDNQYFENICQKLEEENILKKKNDNE